jgi:hypothetical protein
VTKVESVPSSRPPLDRHLQSLQDRERNVTILCDRLIVTVLAGPNTDVLHGDHGAIGLDFDPVLLTSPLPFDLCLLT